MVNSFKVVGKYCWGCRSFDPLYEYGDLKQDYLKCIKNI